MGQPQAEFWFSYSQLRAGEIHRTIQTHLTVLSYGMRTLTQTRPSVPGIDLSGVPSVPLVSSAQQGLGMGGWQQIHSCWSPA